MRGYVVCSYFPDARKKYCQPIGILEFNLDGKKMILWWAERDVQRLIKDASSPLTQRLLVDLPSIINEVTGTGDKLDIKQISKELAEHVGCANIGFSELHKINSDLTVNDLIKIDEKHTIAECESRFTKEKETELAGVGNR